MYFLRMLTETGAQLCLLSKMVCFDDSVLFTVDMHICKRNSFRVLFIIVRDLHQYTYIPIISSCD